MVELLFDLLTAMWFFVLGTCVGSFLNVVVHRLPRHESLLGSSYCPMCRHRILARDNIPILSWIALRGRCRHCGLPISNRYPAVEWFMGVVFLCLALAELAGGGCNLPHPAPYPRYGFAWHLFDPDMRLLATFAFHATLISLLVCLTAMPGPNALPLPLVGFSVVVPLVVGTLYPSVYPSWATPGADAGLAVHMAAGLRTLASGAGGGLILGVLLGLAAHHAPSRTAVGFGFFLAGTYLGWRAVVSIAGLYLLLEAAGCVGSLTGTGRWRSGVSLLVACLVQILSWRTLERFGSWPNQTMSLEGMLVWLVAIAGLAWVVSLAHRLAPGSHASGTR
jgi:leader peptidase (prepilin peptidase)/N-methyltransferase